MARRRDGGVLCTFPRTRPYLLDANSWQRGRSRSLGQVAVRWRLVGDVLGRLRCCTCVLYSATGGWFSFSLRDPRQPGPEPSHPKVRLARAAELGARLDANTVGGNRVPFHRDHQLDR